MFDEQAWATTVQKLMEDAFREGYAAALLDRSEGYTVDLIAGMDGALAEFRARNHDDPIARPAKGDDD